MKKLNIIAICFVLAASVLVACGGGKKANVESQSADGEKYELYYKPQLGETYSQNMTADMKITISAMGQEMDMGVTMAIGMAMTATATAADSSTTYNVRLTEVAMATSGMMGSASFSSNESSDNPVAKMLKGMTEGSFTMSMTKYGRVTSVTGLEEMMNNMYSSMGLSGAELAQAKAMMEQGFSEEKMMEQMQNMTYYPEYPVAVGESWTSVTKTSQLEMENTYTLESVTDNELTIAVSSEIKSFNMQGYTGSIEGTQKGTNVTNRSSGWLKSAEITQAIKGEGKLQGMDAKLTIHTTISMAE